MIRFLLLLGVTIAATMVLLFSVYREGFQTDQETIFVSVASYRDKACMDTINHMYEQATRPDRVYVGITEQNTTDPAENCVPINFKYNNNVRRITIPNTEAKGPTYARYLCSTLYRGETYFCQIDSHTKFAKDWDTKAIKNLKACPDPSSSILTGYPHDSKNYQLNEKSVPVLCDSEFTNDGIPNFKAVIKSEQDVAKKTNIPVPFVAGGFLFGPGKLVIDVPFDPLLDHLFTGEEILLAARLWTSGYNFYASKDNIAFHSYYRQDEAKFHTDLGDWGRKSRAAMERAKRILGLAEPLVPPGSMPYALGTKRSIAQYWAYAGLDPATKTSNSKAKFC